MEVRLVARYSPVKTALLSLILLGLIIACIWPHQLGLEPRPAGEWIRWLALPFLGAVGVFLGMEIFDRRPQIIIDREGIYMRVWSETVIPWTAIARFAVEKQTLRWPIYRRNLCLYLNDPTLYPTTRWRGRFFGRGRNLGYGDITMATGGLDTGIETLREAIERHSAAAAKATEG